jgi:hypothetical protein
VNPDRSRHLNVIFGGRKYCASAAGFTSAMIDERPTDVMSMVREALEMLGAA